MISAETHLQSLLCLGPCIYHDFGQYNAFAFQLMQCFRILADAILSIIFVQSAEIRWPDVIGHLYTSGLAMLSEILTEWVVLCKYFQSVRVRVLWINLAMLFFRYIALALCTLRVILDACRVVTHFPLKPPSLLSLVDRMYA